MIRNDQVYFEDRAVRIGAAGEIGETPRECDTFEPRENKVPKEGVDSVKSAAGISSKMKPRERHGAWRHEHYQ